MGNSNSVPEVNAGNLHAKNFSVSQSFAYDRSASGLTALAYDTVNSSRLLAAAYGPTIKIYGSGGQEFRLPDTFEGQLDSRSSSGSGSSSSSSNNNSGSSSNLVRRSSFGSNSIGGSTVFYLSFLEQGRLISLSADQAVIWDLTDIRPVKIFTPESVNGMANKFTAASLVCDGQPGAPVTGRFIFIGHELGNVTALDTTNLRWSAYGIGLSELQIHLHDKDKHREETRLTEFYRSKDGAISSLQLDAGNRLLLVGYRSGFVVLWKLTSRRIIHSFELSMNGQLGTLTCASWVNRVFTDLELNKPEDESETKKKNKLWEYYFVTGWSTGAIIVSQGLKGTKMTHTRINVGYSPQVSVDAPRSPVMQLSARAVGEAISIYVLGGQPDTEGAGVRLLTLPLIDNPNLFGKNAVSDEVKKVVSAQHVTCTMLARFGEPGDKIDEEEEQESLQGFLGNQGSTMVSNSSMSAPSSSAYQSTSSSSLPHSHSGISSHVSPSSVSSYSVSSVTSSYSTQPSSSSSFSTGSSSSYSSGSYSSSSMSSYSSSSMASYSSSSMSALTSAYASSGTVAQLGSIPARAYAASALSAHPPDSTSSLSTSAVQPDLPASTSSGAPINNYSAAAATSQSASTDYTTFVAKEAKFKSHPDSSSSTSSSSMGSSSSTTSSKDTHLSSDDVVVQEQLAMAQGPNAPAPGMPGRQPGTAAPVANWSVSTTQPATAMSTSTMGSSVSKEPPAHMTYPKVESKSAPLRRSPPFLLVPNPNGYPSDDILIAVWDKRTLAISFHNPLNGQSSLPMSAPFLPISVISPHNIGVLAAFSANPHDKWQQQRLAEIISQMGTIPPDSESARHWLNNKMESGDWPLSSDATAPTGSQLPALVATAEGDTVHLWNATVPSVLTPLASLRVAPSTIRKPSNSSSTFDSSDSSRLLERRFSYGDNKQSAAPMPTSSAATDIKAENKYNQATVVTGTGSGPDRIISGLNPLPDSNTRTAETSSAVLPLDAPRIRCLDFDPETGLLALGTSTGLVLVYTLQAPETERFSNTLSGEKYYNNLPSSGYVPQAPAATYPTNQSSELAKKVPDAPLPPNPNAPAPTFASNAPAPGEPGRQPGTQLSQGIPTEEAMVMQQDRKSALKSQASFHLCLRYGHHASRPIKFVQLVPVKGRVVAVDVDGAISVHPINTKTCQIHRKPFNDLPITAMHIGPAVYSQALVDTIAYFGLADNTIVRYNLMTGKYLSTIPAPIVNNKADPSYGNLVAMLTLNVRGGILTIPTAEHMFRAQIAAASGPGPVQSCFLICYERKLLLTTVPAEDGSLTILHSQSLMSSPSSLAVIACPPGMQLAEPDKDAKSSDGKQQLKSTGAEYALALISRQSVTIHALCSLKPICMIPLAAAGSTLSAITYDGRLCVRTRDSLSCSALFPMQYYGHSERQVLFDRNALARQQEIRQKKYPHHRRGWLTTMFSSPDLITQLEKMRDEDVERQKEEDRRRKEEESRLQQQEAEWRKKREQQEREEAERLEKERREAEELQAKRLKEEQDHVKELDKQAKQKEKEEIDRMNELKRVEQERLAREHETPDQREERLARDQQLAMAQAANAPAPGQPGRQPGTAVQGTVVGGPAPAVDSGISEKPVDSRISYEKPSAMKSEDWEAERVRMDAEGLSAPSQPSTYSKTTVTSSTTTTKTASGSSDKEARELAEIAAAAQQLNKNLAETQTMLQQNVAATKKLEDRAGGLNDNSSTVVEQTTTIKEKQKKSWF